MKNKGFSLVELIVVIAIMAVLVGVLAPQFLGYVKTAKEAVAKDEVFQVVKVANIKLVENETDGKYTFVTANGEAPEEFIDETLAKAVAKGDVISMIVSNSTVTYTKYTSLNGITAVFDISASPTIYVIDEDTIQVLATAYYDFAKSILKNLDTTLNNDKITHSIQEAYALEYGGGLPMFSTTKAGEDVAKLIAENGLSYSKYTDVNSLRWIPSVTTDKKDVIMYAGILKDNNPVSGNISQASIAYYDGNYYYHIHSESDPTSVNNTYVGDTGADIDILKELADAPIGTVLESWMKFEQ